MKKLFGESVSPRPESRPCSGCAVRYATVLRISGRAGCSQTARIAIVGACKHGLRRRMSVGRYGGEPGAAVAMLCGPICDGLFAARAHGTRVCR